jgi:hypothetical protein
MLVSSVVIKHHVNIQRWIYRLLDAAKKSEKLLVSVPRSALGYESSLQHVQGSEQRGSAVPFIVMRPG